MLEIKTICLLADWTYGWRKNFELEDISIETSKIENQTEQRLGRKKKTEYPRTVGTITKGVTYEQQEYQREKRMEIE